VSDTPDDIMLPWTDLQIPDKTTLISAHCIRQLTNSAPGEK
jgi:hypothetical protein